MSQFVASRATPRAAWAVFGAASFIYFIAVVHRTSLGVAGDLALDRFATEALGLSALSVVQIAVYASLQLPAGALLDKWGPKRLLLAGSLIMGVGQLVFALSDNLGWALVARVLIGAGDAPIFVAATRLVSEWFPPRRAPLLVQVTGMLGQIGQLASAVPLAWLLQDLGWNTSFTALATLGLVAGVVAVWKIRMPRHEHVSPPVPAAPGASGEVAPEIDRAPLTALPADAVVTVREAIRPPGVRLAFWTHWTGLFSANTVALVWGFPFFIQAQGLSRPQASTLLTLLVLTNIAVAPVVGALTARHPLRRSWLILFGAAVTALAWAAILIPSTPRPMWQLATLIVVLGIGGPVSLVAMDFARTFGVRGRLGTATGFANVGGFASTVLAVLLIGATLQWLNPGSSDYSLGHYRIAFASMLIPLAVGVAGIIVTRKLTRKQMLEDGIVVPPFREAVRRTWRRSPKI